MNKDILLSVAKTVTIILLAGIITACSNSVSSDGHEDSEPAGFRLKMNGQTIVEQLPEQDVTGNFQLTTGEETDLVTIYFIADDGDEFQPEEDSYSLGYEFVETGIANFEQHAEDGKWSFHIHGESEGSTGLKMKLMHNGHSDFTSLDISVQVEAPAQ